MSEDLVCGVTISAVVCPECREVIPVECGDVTGMTLDEMITEAQAGITHPDHATIHVGAAR